jgi:hypothetical protein
MNRRERSRLLSFASAAVLAHSRAENLRRIALDDLGQPLSDEYKEAVERVMSGQFVDNDASRAAAGAVSWAQANMESYRAFKHSI